MLLSLILLGVYNIIQEINEISHPELTIEHKLGSSRMNMVR